jgi:glycosyltransferase involved in cell wall biosynthesis
MLGQKEAEGFMGGITIIVSFSENGVGAPMAALRLAYGLRERGYDTKVMVIYERTRVETPYHHYEVVWPRRPSAFELPNLVARVAHLLSMQKPDAVVTFLPLANAVGTAAAAIAGIPTRVVSHRVTLESYRVGWRLADIMMARAGIYTDIITVSEAVRASCSFYSKRTLNRTAVIYNGLLDWKPSRLDRAQARSRFALPQTGSILVSTGRLHPDKNFGSLLPIIERLPEVTLVIAGEGPERSKLEHSIRQMRLDDRVRLLGMLQPADIPDLLAAADAFVQPSVIEGQSNSLLEALYAGLPCVANNLPQSYETLKGSDGRAAGAILPVSDQEAWVESLKGILYDPAKRAEVQEVARLRAAYFSFERMISGFEQVLVKDRPQAA